jgi:nucleoid-associated protein YgaU
MAKERPDFSNVKSGSSSRPVAPESAQEKPQDQWYTVARGDSLSKIAKRFYGDGNRWQKIFDANRDQIKDPDLIQPGQKLKIPAAQKSL